MNEKLYRNSDIRLNVIPSNPEGYGLCFFAVPQGLDIESHRRKFAEDAFAKKLPIGEVQDSWYALGKKLIDTYERGLGVGAERAAYGRELFMTPDDAEKEINRIVNDKKHPYNDDRANPRERAQAIAFVNRAYEIKAGLKTTFEGYLTGSEGERDEQIRFAHGNRSSSNGVQLIQQDFSQEGKGIGFGGEKEISSNSAQAGGAA
jgi:hypothetical protein